MLSITTWSQLGEAHQRRRGLATCRRWWRDWTGALFLQVWIYRNRDFKVLLHSWCRLADRWGANPPLTRDLSLDWVATFSLMVFNVKPSRTSTYSVSSPHIEICAAWSILFSIRTFSRAEGMIRGFWFQSYILTLMICPRSLRLRQAGGRESTEVGRSAAARWQSICRWNGTLRKVNAIGTGIFYVRNVSKLSYWRSTRLVVQSPRYMGRVEVTRTTYLHVPHVLRCPHRTTLISILLYKLIYIYI